MYLKWHRFWQRIDLVREAQPQDMISGLLSFLTSPGSGRRDLPLPPLTPLPDRF